MEGRSAEGHGATYRHQHGCRQMLPGHEFETNLRRERQLEGIAKAKAPGVYRGRRPALTRSEALGAVTDQINGPAGHGSPPHCPSDNVENRHDDDGGSDGNECIEENAMSSS